MDYIRTGTAPDGTKVGMTPDGRVEAIQVPQYVKTGTDDKGNRVGLLADGSIQMIEQAPQKTARDRVREAVQVAVDETPIWQRGLVSLGRGMTDVGQGIKQLALHGAEAVGVQPKGTAAAYDKQVADELALYKPFEDQVMGSSIGRATGAALPTILVPAGKLAQTAGGVISKVAPAAGARVAGSMAADAALMGGIQGAVNVADQGESHLGNAAKGAAFGAGAVGALNLLGSAATPFIRRIANVVNPKEVQLAAVKADGTLAPETEFALEKAGIDVNSLTKEARTQFAQLAAQAVKGNPVKPAELARQARLNALPVPIQATKGQLSQDFAQNQLEQSLVKSASSGGPLRQAFNTQDEKLIENLGAFDAKTGAKIAAAGDAAMADTGRSVDKALRARIAQSESRTSALYKKADELGQSNANVDTTPLVDWLTQNGAAAASVPAIKSVADMMRKFGAVAFDEAGNAVAGRPLTAKEADEIYKMAGSLAGDGPSGRFMGQVKRVINQMTEGVEGDAYRAARASRNAHALAFEEPAIIANTVGMKSRTDRAVPFEDVFKKTVISGSIDDLKTLKQTLLANDPETRDLGVQALKDLRGATIKYIKEAATNNAQGTTSEAALRRAYNTIGPEKMEELFGKNTAKQFSNFLDAVKDLKVPPKGTVNYSGTVGELVNWVDRILGAVGGKLGKGAGQAIKNVAEAGAAKGNVEAAVNPMAANAAANEAATVAQQNERVRALLNGPTANKVKKGAAALLAVGVQ